MNEIKVFISYSRKDSLFAGKLKRCFETCVGFEAFLAHDDLHPSDDWPFEILKNLYNTDFVVPLISKNFLSSSFSNQEIGIALAKNKKIIPISIDGTNPEGFINKLQAYKCRKITDEDTIEDIALRAVTQIYFLPIQYPKFSDYKYRALMSLTYALMKSGRFRTTSIIVNIMIQVNKLTKFEEDHIENIVKAAIHNPEVYKADYVFPKLKKFLQDNYKIAIDR